MRGAGRWRGDACRIVRLLGKASVRKPGARLRVSWDVVSFGDRVFRLSRSGMGDLGAGTFRMIGEEKGRTRGTSRACSGMRNEITGTRGDLFQRYQHTFRLACTKTETHRITCIAFLVPRWPGEKSRLFIIVWRSTILGNNGRHRRTLSLTHFRNLLGLSPPIQQPSLEFVATDSPLFQDRLAFA